MFRKNIYYDVKYNILLLGAPNTGKTTLIEHLKGNTRNIYVPTIGIDFYKMDIEGDNNDNNIKCYLWDTGGTDLLKPVIHFYYKRANAIIIMYDVTNRSSFDEVKYWYTYAKQTIKKYIPILLVGNKIDAYQNRIVGIDEGKEMAKLLCVDFIEVSILHNLNLKKDIIEKVLSTFLYRDNKTKTKNKNKNRNKNELELDKNLMNILKIEQSRNELTTIYETNDEVNNDYNTMRENNIQHNKNNIQYNKNNRNNKFKYCYCNIL